LEGVGKGGALKRSRKRRKEEVNDIRRLWRRGRGRGKGERKGMEEEVRFIRREAAEKDFEVSFALADGFLKASELLSVGDFKCSHFQYEVQSS